LRDAAVADGNIRRSNMPAEAAPPALSGLRDSPEPSRRAGAAGLFFDKPNYRARPNLPTIFFLSRSHFARYVFSLFFRRRAIQ